MERDFLDAAGNWWAGLLGLFLACVVPLHLRRLQALVSLARILPSASLLKLRHPSLELDTAKFAAAVAHSVDKMALRFLVRLVHTVMFGFFCFGGALPAVWNAIAGFSGSLWAFLLVGTFSHLSWTAFDVVERFLLATDLPSPGSPTLLGLLASQLFRLMASLLLAFLGGFYPIATLATASVVTLTFVCREFPKKSASVSLGSWTLDFLLSVLLRICFVHFGVGVPPPAVLGFNFKNPSLVSCIAASSLAFPVLCLFGVAAAVAAAATSLSWPGFYWKMGFDSVYPPIGVLLLLGALLFFAETLGVLWAHRIHRARSLLCRDLLQISLASAGPSPSPKRVGATAIAEAAMNMSAVCGEPWETIWQQLS